MKIIAQLGRIITKDMRWVLHLYLVIETDRFKCYSACVLWLCLVIWDVMRSLLSRNLECDWFYSARTRLCPPPNEHLISLRNETELNKRVSSGRNKRQFNGMVGSKLLKAPALWCD